MDSEVNMPEYKSCEEFKPGFCFYDPPPKALKSPPKPDEPCDEDELEDECDGAGEECEGAGEECDGV